MGNSAMQSQWPLPGPPLAWCPPGKNQALAAIPIRPETLACKSLTGPEYRCHLTDRMACMVSRLPEGEQRWAVSQLEHESEKRAFWVPAKNFTARLPREEGSPEGP
jgi:hypothetical protein